MFLCFQTADELYNACRFVPVFALIAHQGFSQRCVTGLFFITAFWKICSFLAKGLSPTKLCPDLVSFACWIVPEFWAFARKSGHSLSKLCPIFCRLRTKLCPNFGRLRAKLCPLSFAPCPFIVYFHCLQKHRSIQLSH